ncbi:MAG: tRNA (adenosine(37)-N6)-threonylcarbamoyltransferase complex dimerization subunit type 1 TsaB [Deferribacteraceae bacterium]|jgi:tRNA threonylcarbamoyl adenosine modification protein YeaZ|nr:tRNA (adenosine(37)-N6)-threonylcarbamoyltransferase complex dimerization subunit type 1 TsaB [Deferribacteraceae bacterium]
MLIFCADSSGAFFTYALAAEDSGKRVLLGAGSYPARGRVNEIFFPAVERFFKENRLTVCDIDRWVVITGPGSFTGIRIGMAGLSGICAALGKKLSGISALDAAALISGKTILTVAAKLKLDEYVLRTYNFISSVYSVLSVVTSDGLPEDAFMADSAMNLAESAADIRSEIFIQEASPLYVKCSEAEINFDKKSRYK